MKTTKNPFGNNQLNLMFLRAFDVSLVKNAHSAKPKCEKFLDRTILL